MKQCQELCFVLFLIDKLKSQYILNVTAKDLTPVLYIKYVCTTHIVEINKPFMYNEGSEKYSKCSTDNNGGEKSLTIYFTNK